MSFLFLLRMECDKVFKRKLPWVGMATIAIIFLLYFSILFEGMRSKIPFASQLFPWPEGIVSGYFMVVSTLPIASIGIFLSIIVAASVTAQEYSWHSLQLWLGQGVSRRQLFVAKFVVCLFTVLLITFGATIIGIITSLIAAIQLHQQVTLAQIDVFQLFVSWLRVSYSILPYTMLAFMLAIVTRSPVAAFSIALFFAAIVEMLMLPLARLSSVANNIWSAMPMQLAVALNTQNFASAHMSAPAIVYSNTLPRVTPGIATLGLAVYTLIFTGLAFLVFCRQNLNQ